MQVSTLVVAVCAILVKTSNALVALYLSSHFRVVPHVYCTASDCDLCGVVLAFSAAFSAFSTFRGVVLITVFIRKH